MTLIFPNVGEVLVLKRILSQTLTLKLYSNDIIPSELDTSDTFIEVVGGGYVSFSLTYENWVIADDGSAIYPARNFQFTGVTSSPGTAYGYYILDENQILLCAERFPTSVLPFTPTSDTLIRITARIRAT